MPFRASSQPPVVAVGQLLPEVAMQELRDHFETVPWSATTDLGAVEGAIGLVPSVAQLDQMPRLRAIATISAGYDAFDVPDLSRRGITLMNCPDALTETTADLAFALILAAARRVTELAEWTRAGRWGEGLPEAGFGVDVHGKTLGIVGMGRIGAAVGRRGALGFGMKVLHTPSRSFRGGFPAEVRDLPALLSQSDFVCLTVPLKPDTDRLIGGEELALMKPTGILVNVARGRVVDEAALIEALTVGTIRAAGLDVYEREPLPPDSPLLKLRNVVLLPHIGSATRETRDAMALASVRNLLDFFIHGTSPNVVNSANNREAV